MVTVYVPVAEELIVSVDVAVPPLVSVMLEGFRDAVRPEGETFVERETVPAKPLRLVKVIVEIAEEPEGLGADPDMVLGHLCAFR